MYLCFAYISTGIGVFPVTKLVILYACISYCEGSRGRSYIFNVDHSVKSCNIDVIWYKHFCRWESPSESLLCSVVVIRTRERELEMRWKFTGRKQKMEATETSQYIQKVFLSFTYIYRSQSGTTLFILPSQFH